VREARKDYWIAVDVSEVDNRDMFDKEGGSSASGRGAKDGSRGTRPRTLHKNQAWRANFLQLNLPPSSFCKSY